MVAPAVVIILVALLRPSYAQTTSAVPTTTMIYQGSTVPISSLLSQTSICSIFNRYWMAAGMTASLPAGATFTLFVPTDAAWSKLSTADQTTLSACLTGSCSATGNNLALLMQYHMLFPMTSSSQFTTSCPVTTTSNPATYKCIMYANPGTQTHALMTQVSSTWYINGARIILADQAAANFTVHFIDKWLYPMDSTTTATAYLNSASSSSAGASSTTCTLCSQTFASLWTTAASSVTAPIYGWNNANPSSQSSYVTMFIPMSNANTNQYSITTLASIISAMQSSSANLTTLAAIAAAHVIPGQVLFLAPWVAAGGSAYGCGTSGYSGGLSQYAATCDLTYFNSTTYAVEVGNTAATIVYPDIPVENGVVHIVSNLLNYDFSNLWSVIQLYPTLSRYRAYAQSDSATMALLTSTSTQYTVIVPDDSSFTSTVTSTLSTWNSSAISQMLQLGIIQTQIMYGSLTQSISFANPIVWSNSAVNGNRLRLSRNSYGYAEVDGGFVSVGGGFLPTYLIQPDVGASNGVLHVVTGNVFGVAQLNIANFLLSRPELSTTAMYYGQMTQAWSLFSNAGTYTVLAPTNAAWTALANNAQLSTITRSGAVALISNLMLRHYASGSAQLYGGSQTSSSGASFSVTTLNGVITFTVSSSSPPQYQVSYASTVTANVNASDFLCTNGRVHIINSVLAISSDTTNMNAGYSCQNPATCSGTSVFVNASLLLLGVIFGIVGRRV